MRFHLKYILILVALWGCRKNDAPPPVEGIVFSPVTPYQEAYPGAIVNFKFRVSAPQSLTGFGVRFKLPGATDFVALPQFPDQTTNANHYAAFRTFEYALPPSATDVEADVLVKFVATAAGRNYEKDYTVKIKKTGLQNLRLYSDTASSYFNFSALDLVNGRGVAKTGDATTVDLIAASAPRNFSLENVTFNVLRGWSGANGARFKLVTAAQYNGAVSQYATIYNGINAANELSAVSTIFVPNVTGLGILVAGQFYIAKVMRNNTAQYIGLSVKKAPFATATTVNNITSLDLANEYLQLEIKK